MVLNALTQSSFSIRVRSTDQGAMSIERVFTITSTPSAALAAQFSSIAAMQTSAAGVVTVTFNRPVTGLGLNDFILTRSGSAVSLTGAAFTAVSTTKYTIDLSTKTGAGGDYELRLKASGAGIKDQFNILLATDTVAKWTNQQISNFVVQLGQTQNSYIRYLDVTFASAEGLAALVAAGNRIKLTKFSLEGTNGVNVAFGTVTRSGSTLRFDFGTNGLGGNRTSNAADGYYQVSFDLLGNGQFNAKKSFYRILGDANGDRQVNSGDYNLISTQTGKPYNANYDILGQGSITPATFLPIITAQNGKRLKTTLQIDG